MWVTIYMVLIWGLIIAESQKVIEDLVKKTKLDQPKDIELVQTHLPHVIHLGDTSHIPLILQSLIVFVTLISLVFGYLSFN